MCDNRLDKVVLLIELRSVCVELGSFEWLITENVRRFRLVLLGCVVNTMGNRWSCLGFGAGAGVVGGRRGSFLSP